MASRDLAPQVPEGWKAVYDDQYQTWFYVNLKTEQSQWEEPEGTTWPRGVEQRPAGPPPSASYSSNVPEKAPEPQYVQQQPEQQQSYPAQQPEAQSQP